MPADTGAITVLIRCRNEARHLGPVLEAVRAQERVADFEVLALDSGSSDGTLDILARHRVRVERLPLGEFSFGHALNVGTELAHGDLVVYLSAHCRPAGPGWLAALVAPFTDPSVVASYGRQLPVPGMNPIEALTTARLFPSAPPAGVSFSNANAAVRCSAVRARPFDEDIPAAEDHLWACGLAPGERIAYVPEAAVYHSHPMTFAEWRFRFYINGLAAAYADHRGLAMPWSGDVITRRAGAFLRLAGTLMREGEVRAILRLPSYALARTICYRRGVREGRRRYGASARSA
jgi:rhamnosyltransferase